MYKQHSNKFSEILKSKQSGNIHIVNEQNGNPCQLTKNLDWSIYMSSFSIKIEHKTNPIQWTETIIIKPWMKNCITHIKTYNIHRFGILWMVQDTNNKQSCFITSKNWLIMWALISQTKLNTIEIHIPNEKSNTRI